MYTGTFLRLVLVFGSVLSFKMPRALPSPPAAFTRRYWPPSLPNIQERRSTKNSLPGGDVAACPHAPTARSYTASCQGSHILPCKLNLPFSTCLPPEAWAASVKKIQKELLIDHRNKHCEHVPAKVSYISLS